MNKRMIFVLSPGRTGTAYLAHVLGSVPGVAASHEPAPSFAQVSRAAQRDDEVAKEFWQQHKLPDIERCNEPVYFETSHQFVYFAEALLELGEPADIVVLTRPHRDVALSHWRRNAIPGQTAAGRMYLSDPAAPGAALPLPNWDTFEDYQLVYWHCLEVEARTNKLVQQYAEAGNIIYRMYLSELSSARGFLNMVWFLGLQYPRPSLYRKLGGKPVNANPEQLLTVGPAADLDLLEAEVERAVGIEPEVREDDPRPSVHIFLPNMGTIREELSEWRAAWQADGRYKVRVQGVQDHPIASTRNRAAMKFLLGGADYVMMIDSDTVPQRNPLDLLALDLDIIALPTPMWMPSKANKWPVYMNIEPLEHLGGEGPDDRYYVKTAEPLLEVKAAGTGCVIIARRVLEHPEMRAPFMDVFDEDGIRKNSEDITFFERARECGFRAWAAMQYQCSHMKTVDLLLIDKLFRRLFETQKRGELEQ